jgi:putative hydrolase of the HAD superfamily
MTRKYWYTDMLDLADTVCVFDLDDTLYAERDYQTSGIKAVSAVLHQLYNLDCEKAFLALRDQSSKNLWAEACELLKLPREVEQSLLWIYRLHEPDIRLADDVRDVVDRCKTECTATAILTDGRAVTQRLKLRALGLADLPCYISEEFRSIKPDEKRFSLIMSEYPAQNYMYIADNPIKDFIAPNALGWVTIGLQSRADNIHIYDVKHLEEHALPTHWINSFAELDSLLSSI